MSMESMSGEGREEVEVAWNELRGKLLGLHTRLGHLDNPLILLHILQTKTDQELRAQIAKMTTL